MFQIRSIPSFLILEVILQSDELFCNLMNHIGNHSPNHEPVVFINSYRREITVPWDEPAEGSAFIHFELLDGKFAIYESYHKVAV